MKEFNDIYEAVREKFKDGDWVFGIGEHKGCSECFDFDTKHPQPFSYLAAVNPEYFRLATNAEIDDANKKFDDRIWNNDKVEE